MGAYAANGNRAKAVAAYLSFENCWLMTLVLTLSLKQKLSI